MAGSNSILTILDSAAENFVFPVLDNGRVYLAASRMSLFRSKADWALVFEIFGFAPRGGIPDVCVTTIGTALTNRTQREDFASEETYVNFLKYNSHSEQRYYHPIESDCWIDTNDEEMVANAGALNLRGKIINLPMAEKYTSANIELSDAKPAVFELCRYLATRHRELVLATDVERKFNVAPNLTELLVLDDWHHPDLMADEKPSATRTFHEIAEVLASGKIKSYSACEARNTHWSNWPEGGMY